MVEVLNVLFDVLFWILFREAEGRDVDVDVDVASSWLRFFRWKAEVFLHLYKSGRWFFVQFPKVEYHLLLKEEQMVYLEDSDLIHAIFVIVIRFWKSHTVDVAQSQFKSWYTTPTIHRISLSPP